MTIREAYKQFKKIFPSEYSSISVRIGREGWLEWTLYTQEWGSESDPFFGVALDRMVERAGKAARELLSKSTDVGVENESRV